jgi:lysophospholipase
LKLYPSQANPEPKGTVVMDVMTADGVRLRAARWRTTARVCKGTICLATGRGEFIEKYFEVIGELRRRGFAVVAFDWRGQGGSERSLPNPRKGDIRDFSEYQRDLAAITSHILVPLMPRPWFGLTHSMGGAIYLSAAHDGTAPFARMVLSAPMIDLVVSEGKSWPRALALFLRAIGLGRDFLPGGGETSAMTKPFADNMLTSDPVRYARNAEAAAQVALLAIGDPTVRWVDAALRVIRSFKAPRYPLELRMPMLVIAAGADRLVSTPATGRFCARMKGGHAIVIPSARHEILMERDDIRDAFWAAFDAFIPGTDPFASSSQDSQGSSMHTGIPGRNDGATA